ncbi:MAG: AsmA family protein [Deltaproteobacteria bacterium]|nr:AsmA family protein [Deltaproteobacteria bacterium]
MKRLLFWIGGAAVLGIVLGLTAMLFADAVITRAINESGHRVLDVETHVESVRLSLLKRTFTLSGIELKNPEGFKAPRMIYLERISLSVDPTSLFGDRIEVGEVEISGAELTYEAVGFGRSNLSVFVEGLRHRLQGNGPLLGPAGKGTGKKTITIDRLNVAGGRVMLSAAFSRGEGIVLALPPLELRHIGRDRAMGISEAVAEVLRKLGHAALSAADESERIP